MYHTSLGICLGLLVPAGATTQQPPAEEEVRTAGFFVPAQRVPLTSDAAGRVAEVLVKEGQSVKKSQSLFRMDRTKQSIEVRRTEGLLQAASARYRLAEGRQRDVAQGELT